MKTKNTDVPIWDRRRPKFLFYGLMACGCCGVGFSKVSKDGFGCSIARKKGASACSNMAVIKQAQIQICEAFARQRGWTISGIYADPGCLGTHTRHPEICRLTRDALAGRFDIVLCEERDHVFRNLRAAVEFQAQMAKAGIHFRTVTEGDMTDALPARKDFIRLLDRLAAADRQSRSHHPQQHA